MSGSPFEALEVHTALVVILTRVTSAEPVSNVTPSSNAGSSMSMVRASEPKSEVLISPALKYTSFKSLNNTFKSVNAVVTVNPAILLISFNGVILLIFLLIRIRGVYDKFCLYVPYREA